MKRKLFSLALVSAASVAFAQQDVFALTGKTSTNIVFSDFRTIDVNHGVSGAAIFSAESSPNVFSQQQNRMITEVKQSFNNSQAVSMASLAYDGLNGKLVYIPMFSSNVYLLDQKSKDITLIESNVVKTTSCDLASHITRMTTGYDRNIYAMSNSGSQLIQISRKDGKYTLTDLGAVKDDSANGENSIKMMTKGFGGDMVADADNNLMVFSASGNVFKVSPKLMTTKFLGKVSGLPANYSLNGAAVNSKGNVVIGSARGESMYEIAMDNLQAKPIAGNLKPVIYDLASSYFLGEKLNLITASGVDIYPTKVEEDFINIRLDDPKITGNVSVEIYDFAGIKVMQKNLPSIEKNRTQRIELNNLKSGVYVVSVVGSNKKVILNKKISVN
ncbi:T9SS type A sorting domain-containing protein [Chryseobacterium suipulveris]|uniref:T9SS type A sorting domain-containing protein n=1 Tax=Chryseobacterium suipulveris TaxID=2929800 RepID=A0ABY4BVP7_9FLAO|nr:T9SS type A sorting domain-containing protein [Chryseobacterium suipulveris]UOE40615.1 T9SS type A sorting domain-containing protein [Chryseobacterium suipulveris]